MVFLSLSLAFLMRCFPFEQSLAALRSALFSPIIETLLFHRVNWLFAHDDFYSAAHRRLYFTCSRRQICALFAYESFPLANEGWSHVTR